VIDGRKADVIGERSCANSLLQELGHKYDLAGNREVEQIGTVQTNGTRNVNLTQASYNARNQMSSRTGGSGAAVFEGTLNEPARVTIGGHQASALWKNGTNSYGFRGTASLATGSNTVAITAQDGNATVQSSGVAKCSFTGSTQISRPRTRRRGSTLW
jgi:hypothetical protein